MGRRQYGPVVSREDFVVGTENTLALSQQLVILAKLGQSDGSIDVCHVHFHSPSHDVVSPTTGLALGESVLGLAVECHEPQLLVELRIIERCGHVETNGAALGCRDILHGMKRENSDVGLGANLLVVVASSNRMGRVAQYENPAQFLLNLTGGSEHGLYLRRVDHLHDGIVIARISGNVDGYDGLRAWRDGFPHGLDRNIEVIARVDHYHLAAGP